MLFFSFDNPITLQIQFHVFRILIQSFDPNNQQIPRFEQYILFFLNGNNKNFTMVDLI